jgi:hypothetical protein
MLPEQVGVDFSVRVLSARGKQLRRTQQASHLLRALTR